MTAVLQAVWATLGVVILVSSLMAGRSRRAYEVGCLAVAVLYLAAGALVNAAFLVRGDDYHDFANGSSWSFVTDTWGSLVVPNRWVFIGLLVLFELAVGVLVLLGGRWRQVGLWLAVAFHVALVSFGWGFLLWSGPMILALVLLIRAARRTGPATGPAGSLSSAVGRRHRADSST